MKFDLLKRSPYHVSTIAQISPNGVAARPVDVNPAALAAQNTTVAKAAESAQKTIQQSKTDTVTISSQALKLASQTYSLAKETRETPSEKPTKRVLDRK